ncbi:MAG TPA: YceI family protein [Candidatus Elarobacter sp.]|jgi:polyisoprenoid-binding protein YceI
MMTIGTLSLCALTAAFTGPAVPSFTGVVWNADPSQSNVTLSVSQFLVAKIHGTIPIASATIVTTDGAVIPLSVGAMLDAARLDTHDRARDADLRSDRFFDVQRFRTITFASDTITATGRDTFAIDGELSMRGVTRSLRLDGTFAGAHVDALGRRHARYEATGRFRRSDYGMASMRGIVGNDVTLDITIDAVDRD